MKLIENTVHGELRRIKKGCVATIGNFDGVHAGHQQILNAAKKKAQEAATEFVVITFEPHPMAVLKPQIAPGILTPLKLKQKLLAEFGVDYLFVLKSDARLFSLSCEEFVDEFLVQGIQPGLVVEGRQFNFGADRSGDVLMLRKLGAKKSFDVITVPSKEAKFPGGQILEISSTMIRDMLEDGRVADAAIAMGRPYRLIEQIMPGRGKGKKLGFPTLNMKKPKQIIPLRGVYAGFTELADSFESLCERKEKIPAVFSIGRTRTYGQGHPLMIEAHLLKENVGDLVGSYMAMDFIKFIRCQIKFETEAKLIAQIKNDCENAKKILAADIIN